MAHLRDRKAITSFRPLMNSDRFHHRESIVYAKATFAGSRVFQASSARRTFCIALSRVNGGKGGRAAVVSVAMISSPWTDSFGISINSRTRAGDLVGGRVEGDGRHRQCEPALRALLSGSCGSDFNCPPDYCLCVCTADIVPTLSRSLQWECLRVSER